jgi:hypothetical protein
MRIQPSIFTEMPILPHWPAFLTATVSVLIFMRVEVRDAAKFFETDSRMRTLHLGGVAFPNLQSLEIKIKLVKFSYNNKETFDKRFIQVDALFGIFQVQSSHDQLRHFFERDTPKKNEIVFRLVVASTGGHEDVGIWTSRL